MKSIKERPILFIGPMVRAILEGRKTQTRRKIKPQPHETHWKNLDGYKLLLSGPHNMSCGRLGVRFQHYIPQNKVGDTATWAMCPYGKPGDRLWVRETFTLTQHNLPVYRSDSRDKDGKFWPSVHSDPNAVLWRPSIYMPRIASRIDLEITGIRVERLKDISNEDCWKEGMSDQTNPQLKANRKWFSELWESINGEGSWDANQWVWVVEFKRVKP